MEPETIVGIFDAYDDAQSAINELLADGFAPEGINLLANNDAECLATGCLPGMAEGDAENEVRYRCGALSGVGPLLAVGSLATSIARDNSGSGLQLFGISANEAAYYGDGLRDGGTLIAVRTNSDGERQQTRAVLSRYGGMTAPSATGNRRPGMRDAARLVPDPDLYADEDSLFEITPAADTGIRAYAARL